jgi:hypothetical protein
MFRASLAGFGFAGGIRESQSVLGREVFTAADRFWRADNSHSEFCGSHWFSATPAPIGDSVVTSSMDSKSLTFQGRFEDARFTSINRQGDNVADRY